MLRFLGLITLLVLVFRNPRIAYWLALPFIAVFLGFLFAFYTEGLTL